MRIEHDGDRGTCESVGEPTNLAQQRRVAAVNPVKISDADYAAAVSIGYLCKRNDLRHEEWTFQSGSGSVPVNARLPVGAGEGGTKEAIMNQ
jgi:hypothetical protein